MSDLEPPGGQGSPRLDPRTILLVVLAAGAGAAAAHDSALATAVTVGLGVLVALQGMVGRWRR